MKFRLFLLSLLLIASTAVAEESCKGELGEEVTLCALSKKVDIMQHSLNSQEESIKFLTQTIKRQQSIIEELTAIIATKKVAQEVKEGQNLNYTSPKDAFESFRPSTFKTKKALFALKEPSQKSAESKEFKEGEAFTSKGKVYGYLKVSGYFTDGKWTGAREDMWIKEEDVELRD